MMSKSKSSFFTFTTKTVTAVVICCALFFFISCQEGYNYSASSTPDDVFTVIIDPGHGGEDTGANSEQVFEKDIVLNIANALAELNKDPKIKYIFTRDKDQFISLPDRVKLAEKFNADMYVSLHVDTNPNNPNLNGIRIYYSDKNPVLEKTISYSNVFGSKFHKAIIQRGKPVIESSDMFVLKNTPCPSVLIELGFMSNKKDLAYFSSPDYYNDMASQIAETVSILSKEP